MEKRLDYTYLEDVRETEEFKKLLGKRWENFSYPRPVCEEDFFELYAKQEVQGISRVAILWERSEDGLPVGYKVVSTDAWCE